MSGPTAEQIGGFVDEDGYRSWLGLDVVRAGRSMGVADVEVTSETAERREIVAVGRTSYRLFRGGA